VALYVNLTRGVSWHESVPPAGEVRETGSALASLFLPEQAPCGLPRKAAGCVHELPKKSEFIVDANRACVSAALRHAIPICELYSVPGIA